jgi:hypothetical protein
LTQEDAEYKISSNEGEIAAWLGDLDFGFAVASGILQYHGDEMEQLTGWLDNYFSERLGDFRREKVVITYENTKTYETTKNRQFNFVYSYNFVLS